MEALARAVMRPRAKRANEQRAERRKLLVPCSSASKLTKGQMGTLFARKPLRAKVRTLFFCSPVAKIKAN